MPGVDVALTNDYRDRAAALYRMVIAALDADVAADAADPWPVLPWGFANLRLAQIESDRGDRAAVTALLEAALPALEAVRSAAHADQWDEVLVREAARLREE